MFDYRIAYGCWLNDSRTEPVADEDWPSIRIDEGTLASLDMTMAFLKMAGYNYFDVFGLVTNHSWEDDIVSTVSAERRDLVNKVIQIIHRHGIKLIYGLGVYSWGFDGIISRNRAVRGTNPQVMCASAKASEDVMEKVISFVAETFDIDGFHLEAADQGRCNCDKCAETASDTDYYNGINKLVAAYIRKRWPDKVLLANTSGYLAWGDTITKGELEKIKGLGKAIDVFIDVGSHGAFVADGDRREFIKGFPASFGTANGFWVYPPQRWDRTRWLIPHMQQNRRHLKRLYEDGGRSCELYLSPLNNPGAEITFLCNGLFLQDPSKSMDEILGEAVDFLYKPKSPKQKELIIDVLKGAEDLFFQCWHPVRDRGVSEEYSDGVERIFAWSAARPELAVPGELFLERLFGVGPGFPCYLTVHFSPEGRRKYRTGMLKLHEKAEAAHSLGPGDKTGNLALCIQNVLKDIDLADSAAG